MEEGKGGGGGRERGRERKTKGEKKRSCRSSSSPFEKILQFDHRLEYKRDSLRVIRKRNIYMVLVLAMIVRTKVWF